MEYTEEIVERIRREAYQDGFDAAMEKLRLSVRLAKMGEADCKIVDKTGLPPYIIHAMIGED